MKEKREKEREEKDKLRAEKERKRREAREDGENAYACWLVKKKKLAKERQREKE